MILFHLNDTARKWMVLRKACHCILGPESDFWQSIGPWEFLSLICSSRGICQPTFSSNASSWSTNLNLEIFCKFALPISIQLLWTSTGDCCLPQAHGTTQCIVSFPVYNILCIATLNDGEPWNGKSSGACLKASSSWDWKLDLRSPGQAWHSLTCLQFLFIFDLKISGYFLVSKHTVFVVTFTLSFSKTMYKVFDTATGKLTFYPD